MSETLSDFMRVPVAPSMKRELARIAKRDDRTVSWVARAAFQKYLDADKQRRAAK